MPFIIVDERHIDEALNDTEWNQIKKLAWLYPIIDQLAKGETVDSNELTDVVETMPNVTHAFQTLIAYALGGNSVRIE